MPSSRPPREASASPSRAAINPPATNTQALAMPASSRCSSSAGAAVTKPLPAMNRLASTAPTTSSRLTPKRRISAGVTSAPTR